MASYVSVGFDLPQERDPEESNGPEHRKMHLGDSQAGVLELSTLITNPGLKRAESSELLNLSIHQVARDGDTKLLKKLLASMHGNVKKKINVHDDEDLSALHYAARYNHYNVVKMLVEAGANVNDKDVEGGTPLHFAARYKRMRLIQPQHEEQENHDAAQEPDAWALLQHYMQPNGVGGPGPMAPVPEISTADNSVIMYMVSQRACINEEDIYGCTPLHFAAMRGNEVATKELLSCPGIHIEKIDKQLMTALHMAASHDEKEIVRMLIEAGANLRCCDEDMATPLHYACMEGSTEIAQMLFEAGRKQNEWVTVSQMVTDQDNQQNTPLHYAVENTSYDVTKLCLEKGADVNAVRSNYQTPLHLAAVAGDVRIIELLLDKQARIDALDIGQETPMHKAAAFNHSEIVEFLIQRGANINKHDKDNFSPLLIASCKGHGETIKTLLAHGANIFDTDKNDKTAIFWAAEEDKLDALTVLLEHPSAAALLSLCDRYDYSPLHMAAQNGFISIVRALLDAGADLDAKNEEEQTPLHLAAKKGKTNVVRELVKRNKMVINDEDEDSNTALHLASLAGHTKVVLALLEAGADIEARNCTLWTPLDCAAAKGFAKTVKTLLEADAPVDPMDKTKTTPLHLASQRGHTAVVQLLVQWQANVAQLDSDGNNCLDLAIDAGQKDVAKVIISSNKWKESLSNETLNLTTGLRDTPMRKLIRKMPDIAEDVFNRCTTSNMTNPDHVNYAITFEYEFLDDMYANWREGESVDAMSSSGSIYDDDNKLVAEAKPYSSDSNVLKKNHPMMIMVQTDQEDLLAHPLVTSLLRHKWNSFGRYVYYLNFLIYCVFLTFLTGYICSTKAPFLHHKGNKSLTSCLEMENIVITTEGVAKQKLFASIGKYVIMALAGLNILREVFQMYTAKWNYFGWENLIEWTTYVTALLLVIDFDECQQRTGLRQEWQWQLGAAAIFLAWMDLVLFIRKFPRFGIYVVMFTDILYTFVQFFPVFFLFIVAFALSFYMLLQNQDAFETEGLSLMKTSVMMIGEFEYNGIFLNEVDDASNEENHAVRVYYQGITFLLFILFLILVSIIIMNLLVGLAVDDIKAVQEQAVLKRLAMQVELAMSVEGVLPQFIRRKFVVKCRTITPNHKTSNPFKKMIHLESNMLSAQAITKALNPELDDMEQVHENQDKMNAELGRLRYRMKQMSQQNAQLTMMMSALLKHNNINLDEEDIVEEEMTGLLGV